MHLLFNYFYYYINKSNEYKYYLNLINNFYNYKREYLNNHNITVMDYSRFQDFTLKCHGSHIDPLRKSYIQGKLKVSKNKPFKFTYIPDGTKKKIKYEYDNITGLKINNQKLFIIKK